MWIGIVAFIIITFALMGWGYLVYQVSTFGSNLVASLVGASLGATLSLLTVALSFAITHQHRRENLSYARFAFLRRQGEHLWQMYIAFCQSLGADTTTIDKYTWNSADRAFWPSDQKLQRFINY